jgi:hypothetical protein
MLFGSSHGVKSQKRQNGKTNFLRTRLRQVKQIKNRITTQICNQSILKGKFAPSSKEKKGKFAENSLLIFSSPGQTIQWNQPSKRIPPLHCSASRDNSPLQCKPAAPSPAASGILQDHRYSPKIGQHRRVNQDSCSIPAPRPRRQIIQRGFHCSLHIEGRR